MATAATANQPSDRAPGPPARSRRRFVLIGVGVIAAIAVASAGVIWTEREDAKAAYTTATANLGNGMAQQTTQVFAALDRALKEVQAAVAAALDAAPDRPAAAMRAGAGRDLLVDHAKRLTHVAGLALVDAAGDIAASSGSWAATPPNVSDQDFFVHLRQDDAGGAFLSAPSRSPASGKWIAFMARRINDSRGGFAGIVVAEVSLASLQEFYRVAMPVRRVVTLVRRDGVVLVRHPARDEDIGQKIPADRGWYAAVAKGGAAYGGTDYFTATPIIGFARPLKDLPVVVEASVTEADVLVDWPRQILIVLLGAAAAIVGVILLLRHLAGQVDRLERSELSLAAKNSQIETAHRQLDAALANISIGVCFFDGDQRLIVSNRRYHEIYQLPPHATVPGTSLVEIVGHRFTVGTLPRGTRDVEAAVYDVVTKSAEPRQMVLDLMNGRSILVNHQPMPDGGWVATHEDITERRAAEAKITFLARHDVLTGLANRAQLEEEMGHALAGIGRGTGFAVLFLDLDRFKAANDTFGHQVGDDLLRAVAVRLLACVREQDTVARLGGDEFVILQSDLAYPADAARLAGRIIEKILEPYSISGQEVVIGTSIGIAVAPTDGTASELLLKNADTALYIAKREGRGTFRFFEPELDAKVQNRHDLERDLRTAVARGQFEVYYQPFVGVRTGRVCGFEALLRWNHPVRGLIGPGEFIAVAEECRLIVPIGEWLLREACVRATTWPDDVRLAVNLSPIQFRYADVSDMVGAALRDSGLPAHRLELEITESALMAYTDKSLATLHELRERGVGIAMDDFGTGYSSLSYLRQFPLDKVKIDQSFVRDITQHQELLFIVRAIVSLCQNLGIRTTAEGIETADQLEILAAEGCTEMQGYLFGRPQPADQLGRLLDGVPRIAERLRAAPDRAIGGELVPLVPAAE